VGTSAQSACSCGRLRYTSQRSIQAVVWAFDEARDHELPAWAKAPYELGGELLGQGLRQEIVEARGVDEVHVLDAVGTVHQLLGRAEHGGDAVHSLLAIHGVQAAQVVIEGDEALERPGLHCGRALAFAEMSAGNRSSTRRFRATGSAIHERSKMCDAPTHRRKCGAFAGEPGEDSKSTRTWRELRRETAQHVIQQNSIARIAPWSLESARGVGAGVNLGTQCPHSRPRHDGLPLLTREVTPQTVQSSVQTF